MLRGVHVLLVSDEDDARDILDRYLREVGAVVTLARDGAEAFAVLEQAQIDIVVSDLSMPGMDGVDLIARLRGFRSRESQPAPAIAITAYPREYDPLKLRGAGFRSFLLKPVDPARVAGEVRHLMDYYGPKVASAPETR